MSAATVVFAREDLSIPGAAETVSGKDDEAINSEANFFTLVRDSNPDVIVLDLSDRPFTGVATILKIRRQCQIPILAVCDPNHPSIATFCIAGAADCITTPIDLLQLNEKLQQIIRVTQSKPQAWNAPNVFTFAGLTFYPYRDLLTVQSGATLPLTSLESRLLQHFVSHPGRLCPRAELSGALYGDHRASGDRAIDTVVNRLRHKLVLLRGAAAQTLIKTEFRRGYLFVSTVSTADGSGADAAA